MRITAALLCTLVSAAALAAGSHGVKVQLAPTQGNDVSGSLTVSGATKGVHIKGQVHGLKPNAELGFHIHEKGDCSAPDGSSAGGHFNPSQQQHGDPKGASHHAGDMLNLHSDAKGVAKVDVTAAGATLGDGQPTDVSGRALVVHENADDYKTQPSGNSGKRVACGVIGLKKE